VEIELCFIRLVDSEGFTQCELRSSSDLSRSPASRQGENRMQGIIQLASLADIRFVKLFETAMDRAPGGLNAANELGRIRFGQRRTIERLPRQIGHTASAIGGNHRPAATEL
jgi:hypothetical protein